MKALRVPTLPQAVQQPDQGQCDTLGFGRVGFGHHTDMGFPGLDDRCGMHQWLLSLSVVPAWRRIPVGHKPPLADVRYAEYQLNHNTLNS